MKIIKRAKRNFLPENFELKKWEDLEKFYQELLDREIRSLEDLQKFLKDRSELESYLEENFAWRYINMNCDTENEKKKQAFLFFVQEIQPKISPLSDKLNKKLIGAISLENYPKNTKYFTEN